jgi:hypothetical protein
MERFSQAREILVNSLNREEGKLEINAVLTALSDLHLKLNLDAIKTTAASSREGAETVLRGCEEDFRLGMECTHLELDDYFKKRQQTI